MNEFAENLEPAEMMKQIRIRYYKTLKQVYWNTFIEGQCINDSVNFLIDAANTALDSKLELLDSFQGLQEHFVSNGYLKFLYRF